MLTHPPRIPHNPIRPGAPALGPGRRREESPHRAPEEAEARPPCSAAVLVLIAVVEGD